jgi:hypothetical protein
LVSRLFSLARSGLQRELGSFPLVAYWMIASVFLLSPYFPIFERRPKRDNPYKIESHQQA